MSKEKKKPGRKPIGDRAMTNAEKKRAYHERRKAKGLVTAQFTVTASQRIILPIVARVEGYKSTSAFLSAVIAEKLTELAPTVQAAEEWLQRTIESNSSE